MIILFLRRGTLYPAELRAEKSVLHLWIERKRSPLFVRPQPQAKLHGVHRVKAVLPLFPIHPAELRAEILFYTFTQMQNRSLL
jgi:hypothetical protein